MKCVIVTNTPAPYREKIYEMVSIFLNGSFHVIYSQEKESNRKWKVNFGVYQKTVLRGIHISYKDRFIHINFGIFSLLNNLNPDILITTEFSPTFLFAIIWCKLNNKRHISFTDGWLKYEQNLSFFHKLIRKLVFSYSKAFIGASKQSVNLFLHYGCNKERIFQSQLCIDNEKYFNEPKEGKQYDVMFCGQIISLKMPEFFLDVVDLIKSKIGHCKVLIVGDGKMREYFLHELQRRKIDFHYAGFLSQEQLPKHYVQARVFLFPTKKDCWGIVVNEACAAGLPVITCDNSGAAHELIVDGFNGFICQLDPEIWAEKAAQLLSNDEMYNDFSRKAVEKVMEFNFNKAAQGLINAIELVDRG